MRIAVLASLLLVGISAHASWYQIYCSNGEGTVKISSGHVEEAIYVTERIWNEGQRTDRMIRNENAEWAAKVEEEKKLESSVEDSCKKGEKNDMVSWRTVTYQRVNITKADGSSFSKNTLGVSEDGKSVKASVICEENGSSEVICGEQ